jgi:hypothetical protein
MRDVGIGECRAETRHRFDIAERANQRRLFVVEHHKNIVDQWREPGALRGEIEDTELACNPGIFQLELRIEIDYAVVPPQFAPIHHDGLGYSEKRLGVRADLKDCVSIDGQSIALASYAEALGVNEPVSGNDSNGYAWNVESLHSVNNVSFDIRNQLLNPALHSRFGLGWFRPFRGIQEVESKSNDDCQGRKEDRQNTAVNFGSGYFRCALQRHP